MAKKRLLEINLLDRLFKTFLKAKSDSKESEWLQKLRKSDPELADIWNGWDQDVTKLMKGNQNMLQKLGLGDSDAATDAKDVIKRYGLK